VRVYIYAAYRVFSALGRLSAGKTSRVAVCTYYYYCYYYYCDGMKNWYFVCNSAVDYGATAATTGQMITRAHARYADGPGGGLLLGFYFVVFLINFRVHDDIIMIFMSSVYVYTDRVQCKGRRHIITRDTLIPKTVGYRLVTYYYYYYRRMRTRTRASCTRGRETRRVRQVENVRNYNIY